MGAPQMHNTNWDDLRFVLAVAESGSVSAAARELGVNHATVLRRISAFEELHRAQVFERSAQGYQLRPESVGLIEAARAASEAMNRVTDILGGAGVPERNAIRITTVDTLSLAVLAPAFAQLQKAAQPRPLALMTGNARLDMARLQADIAVRPAESLPDDLTGRISAQMGFAAYRTAAAGDEWLGLSGPLAGSKPAQWMRSAVPRDAVNGSADSFSALRVMARSGAGCAYLPCILGDGDPELMRLPRSEAPWFSVPVWVAVHCDLDDAPWLGGLRRALERVMRQNEVALSGGVAD